MPLEYGTESAHFSPELGRRGYRSFSPNILARRDIPLKKGRTGGSFTLMSLLKGESESW